MKKYIRTENRIYELKDNMKISFEKLFEDISNEVGSMYGTEEWVCYGNVLQQADTIEELCDEFVIIRDNTKINQLVRTDNINYLKELIKEDKSIVAIMGAIWTDKGLIYVAKMNDEGKLCLI